MYEKYWKEELGLDQIAEIVGACQSNVTHHMDRLGIKRRGISEAKKVSHRFRGMEKHPQLYSKGWLHRKYWEEKLSIMQIAKVVGCSYTNVWDHMVALGIKRRTLSETTRGKNNPNYGKYPSERVRQKMREARRHQKIPTHHTKPELIFEEICKKYNLPFRYVGDASLWIGKKGEKQLNPDFIETNGRKVCVEVMGSFWHSSLYNRRLGESALLPFREKHYKKYGWESIFIWESELKSENAEKIVLDRLRRVEGIV